MAGCEQFWSGVFGDEYTERNTDIHDRFPFFERVLGGLDISSVIEFGPNTGANLLALEKLGINQGNMIGIEINGLASERLSKILPDANIIHESAYGVDTSFVDADLSLSMGFLIHQPPELLDEIIEAIVSSCKVGGYILLGEYFAPTETEVEYRGHAGKMWRRDYGGIMLDAYPKELELIGYGFISRRDKITPMDDITWWLIRKSQ